MTPNKPEPRPEMITIIALLIFIMLGIFGLHNQLTQVSEEVRQHGCK